jgi:hypothetical protein
MTQAHSDYASLPGVNFSTLKAMRRSPKHYRYLLDNPLPDSNVFAFGRAVHTAVLEPDRLPLDYVVFFGERRAGKEWAAFCEQHPHQTILKRDEYDLALAVRDAVRSHPVAAEILRSGTVEQTITWTDAETGIECKARADFVGPAGLLDLKTTQDVDARTFGMTAAKYGYHAQLAFYRAGLLANGIDVPAKIVAVEKDAPHDVAVFGLDDASLYAGEEEVAKLLRLVAACRERDEWPGRYPGEVALELPRWCFPDDDAADALGIIFGSKEAA